MTCIRIIGTLPDYISPALDNEYIEEYFIDPYLSLVAGALSKKQQDSVHRVTNNLWVNLYIPFNLHAQFKTQKQNPDDIDRVLSNYLRSKPSVVAYAYEDRQPSIAPYDDR